VSERRLLAAARRLGDRAEAALGERPDTVAHIARAAMDALDRDGEDHPGAAELIELAVRALDLDAALRRHEKDRQERRRRELERSLARLRATSTTAELTDAIREEDDGVAGFAESAGRIYERAVALELLEAQEAIVREAQGATEAIMSSLQGDIELVRLVGRSDAPGRRDDGDVSPRARRTAFDAQLTRRERDVLALMSQGKGNDAIAEQLAVTRSTVKSHVRNILRKIGAVNRAEAISRYHAMT
jgi:DNA-binding CsgD family transcriptional regulator